MDANKPTFDSLSPERVNALIAEKVMGWHKEFYRYGAEPEYVSPYESWVDAEGVERKQVLHSIYAQCSCSVFTPMTLLDDCWLVEEKMLSTPLNVFDSFLQQLFRLFYENIKRECPYWYLVERKYESIGQYKGKAVAVDYGNDCIALQQDKMYRLAPLDAKGFDAIPEEEDHV